MMKGKCILAVFSLLGCTAMATAQGIEIDDDGWSRVDGSETNTFMVDVDDDGFERMDKPTGTMDEPFATGGCTQLEMQMNMSGDECGQMSKAELAASYIGAHD